MNADYIPDGDSRLTAIYERDMERRAPADPDEKADEPEEDDDTYYIPCSFCDKPTTFDSVYGDLCSDCCRASNE